MIARAATGWGVDDVDAAVGVVEALRGAPAYGAAALPIWINYMKTALKGVPEIPRKPPGGVVSATVSGDGEGLVDTGAVSDWFYSEFPPRRFVDPLTGNEGGRSKQDEEVRQQLF